MRQPDRRNFDSRAMAAIAAALLAMSLAGCSSWAFPGVYKINVEQGNIVTQEMVGQLKPGMTRAQVRYILGTPLIEDPFDQSRWDYLYVLRNGDKTLVDQRLTVFFEGDVLTHYDSTLTPEDKADEETPAEQNPADKA